MHTGHVLFLEGGATHSIEIQSVLTDLNCIVHLINDLNDASNVLREYKVDLMILSVEGNRGATIIEYAQSLKTYDLPIIFLTHDNDKERYEKAQQANMVAYIVSPFDMLTLRSIVSHNLNNKLEKELKNKWSPKKYMEDALFIKVNQLLQKVTIENITHVRSEGNYCLIFTTEKKYAIKLSMVRLNNSLSEKGFIQVHKSYLAKLNRIDNIDISSNEVILGEVRIPLGRKYKQDLLAHLNLF